MVAITTTSGAATEARNVCSLWVRVQIGTRQRHCAAALSGEYQPLPHRHTDSDSSDGDGSGGNIESGECPTTVGHPSAGDGGEGGNGKRYTAVAINKPGSGCTHVYPLPAYGSEVGGAGSGAAPGPGIRWPCTLMDQITQTLYGAAEPAAIPPWP